MAAGGCEMCTAKEKELFMQKLKSDAKIEAKNQGKALAICEDSDSRTGYTFIDPRDAISQGYRIVDIISNL